MNDLVPPGEHELLVLWVQLAALLLVARALGELMKRLDQPAVVGELAAGILLGPSVLGRVWPSGLGWLFPGEAVSSAMLFTVSWVGVLFLLVVTGLETDTRLLRTLGRTAVVVTVASIAVPFAVGLVPGSVMPDRFIGEAGNRLLFTLFVAAALTTSSLAVIAKILGDLGLLRRSFGQVTLAAGMGNEVFGYIVLGLIAGLATVGAVSLGSIVTDVAGVALFLVVAWVGGQRLVDDGFRRLRRSGADETAWVTSAGVLALGAGAVTAALGVEAVLGAFVAGILIGRSRYGHEGLREHLETFTNGLVAPIFFATAGLRVDLGLLAEGTVLAWALILLAVALGAKFVGTWVGARLAGVTARDATALGVGLNARGVLEVLIATVALSVGVFNGASYTIAVLIAIVSSMLTAPLLRLVVRGWRGTAEEQERLDREETLGRNRVVRPRRILLPSRGGASSLLAASVLHLAWPEEAGVTVLTVDADGAPADVSALRAVLHGRPLEELRAPGREALATILEEARLNYGVIGVAAMDAKPGERLFSPLVDDLLHLSPVPLVVIRAGTRMAEELAADGEGGAPPALIEPYFRRLLVPTDGTATSRAAHEVAFALAGRLGADVELLHVVTGEGEQNALGRAPRGRAAEQVLASGRRTAEEAGLRVWSHLRRGPSSAREIVGASRDLGADLIVMGADLRTVEGRPYVGHGVEEVLERAEATVVVVVVGPPGDREGAVPADGARGDRASPPKPAAG